MSTVTLNKDRLAECRRKLGITKLEASIRMNMSQPAYVRYESGSRAPAIHVIKTMADVLGTSVAYLTDATDDPRPDTYVIRSGDDDELFELVELFKSSDQNLKKRLLAVAKELSNM